jgi:hypothetical protein
MMKHILFGMLCAYTLRAGSQKQGAVIWVNPIPVFFHASNLLAGKMKTGQLTNEDYL